MNDYAYGERNHGPHAVTTANGVEYTYDLNGNLVSTNDGATASWTGFDKPRWLAEAGAGSGFHYNLNRQRVVQHTFTSLPDGATPAFTEKKLYIGGGMEADYSLGASELELDRVRLYVTTPSGRSGAVEIDADYTAGAAHKRLVYHQDHLGSIDVLTEFVDQAVALDWASRPSRYSYDPWGERRDPSDWSGSPTTTTHGGEDDLTPRGFTDHEMLDDLGLVHMNGRIYDPLLGRFLSADIVVQAPGNLQSYNRYSYVMNNPLTMTDPTGYFWDPDSGFWGAAEWGTFGKAAVVDPAVEGYKSGSLQMEKGMTEWANASDSSTPGLDRTLAVLHVVAGVGEGVGIVADYAPGGKQVTATAGALAKHADELGDAASRATKALSGKADDAAGGAGQAQRRLDGASVDNKKLDEVKTKEAPTSEATNAPRRRTQTEGDVTLESESAARREAFRRNDVSTSEPNNFTREKVYGKNDNLKGPKGEPSEVVKTKNLHGDDIEIDHHNHGHNFPDGTYERPHYQGPDGEHISY